ncbi:hypothetical protein TWF594_005721 [Orbilia oligospora]|nr:hypothetical protein TWF706_004271 [Orbilia oligospora]KAF3151964.1 hypothetical protein TWF594_005721 [Orbilia oligospora]
MKSGLRTQILSQWLTIAAFIAAPLVRADIVTISFQDFKEGLKYSSASTIGPLRTEISNLEKLTTSVYPIELPSGANSPTGVRKTVSTKLWGLQYGIDLAREELADPDVEYGQADLGVLEDLLQDIQKKFITFSTTNIQVPDGFYTIPDPYKSKPTDIWTFINSLSNHLVANGGLDNPEASAGRLVSFLFSAPLPDSGTITLDFDAFDLRVRTLRKLMETLENVIKKAPDLTAPSDDIQLYIKTLKDYDLSNASELEAFVVAGYEDVITMLKTYLKAVSDIFWTADELYWELKGLWLPV